MKALSLQQPWAELILQGKKTIETRKWNTSFRGEFLIHASGRIDSESAQKFNLKSLPIQCIVGKAELVGVKKYSTREEFVADVEKHLMQLAHDKPWTKPRYGFLLKNVKRLKPVQVKGQLNFFEVDLD